MTFRSDSGWQKLFCSECGQKISPAQVQRPFADARLCSSCVTDLFINSQPVERHHSP